jgi:insertion element IS1 protein InsB
LKKKLSLFDIDIFYTDNRGAYKKHLPVTKHIIGKSQAIERLHLTFRTRIKRLCRKTICFSKLKELDGAVIGLFINVTEFGNSIRSLSTF